MTNAESHFPGPCPPDRRRQGKVRMGTTNVSVRGLSIRKDAVRIQLVDSAEEKELKLQTGK